MSNNNHNVRCNDCDRIHGRCLCAFKPKDFIESDQLWAKQEFKLYVIQSIRERDHYKNSSVFLKFMVKDYYKLLISLPSHHIEYSQQRKQWKAIDELIATEFKSEQNLSLLYPNAEQSQDRVKSTPTKKNSEANKIRINTSLVLLDMTWGHSKRLIANSSALKQIPRLTLETREIESSQSKVSLFFRDTIMGTETLEKVCYSRVRNGKRKTYEINSFEAVVYALLSQGLMNLEQITPVWTQYQYWLKQMSSAYRLK